METKIRSHSIFSYLHSGCYVAVPDSWTLIREGEVTQLRSTIFVGWQLLNVTVCEDVFAGRQVCIEISKRCECCKPHFKLPGFQEVWPIQTCLIKMSLFSHPLQDCWHQYIFFLKLNKIFQFWFAWLLVYC